MRGSSAVLILIILMVISAACMDKGQSQISDPTPTPEIKVIQSHEELEGELIIALSTQQNYYVNDPTPRDPAELVTHKNMPIYERINEFMALHPKVDVKVQLVTWFSFDTTASGLFHPDFSTMPDIIELTPNQVRWAADGQLEDLYFYLENFSDAGWGRDYMTLLDAAAIDMQHYLLPVRSDPMVVYYSQQIFDDLAIPYPEEGWTWSDFYRIQEQLNRAKQVSTGLLNMANIEHIIQEYGGTYMSADGEGFVETLDSEETYDAFRSYVAQIDLGVLFQLDPQMFDDSLLLDFPAFGIVRSSQADFAFREVHIAPRNYAFAPMPTSDQGQPSNNILVSGLAMTKQAQDKHLAWELMRYIVGDDPREPMSLVVNNTFDMHYNTSVSKDADGNVIELDRDKTERLMQLMYTESLHAKVSSLSMVPTYLGGRAEEEYDVPWEFSPGENLETYLQRFAKSIDQIRDEIKLRGLGSTS